MEHLTMESSLFERARQHNVPINGSLELLPLCNMNCKMCYVRLDRKEMEAQGRIRSLEEWLSLGREMVDAGTMFLLLTGGEPLLYPDFRELYVGLQRMGLILTVNTNGTLIDDSWVQFFKEYRPRRLNITLYGASENTYRELCHYEDGYTRVIRAIRSLREADIDVKMNASLVKSNYKDLERILEMAKELDCPVNVDTYMQPASRERSKPFDLQCRLDPCDAAKAYLHIYELNHNSEEYKEKLRSIVEAVECVDQYPVEPIGITCLAGKCSFSVNWQGKLRACVMLPEPEGDVFQNGFLPVWNRISGKCAEIYLSETCSSCKYRMICNTCAACALHETGSRDGVPEYLCEYSRRMYEIAKRELDTSHL